MTPDDGCVHGRFGSATIPPPVVAIADAAAALDDDDDDDADAAADDDEEEEDDINVTSRRAFVSMVEPSPDEVYFYFYE